MIDFTTLQGLAIPEGVVTQITKDGVVLWSGDDGMRNITIVQQSSLTSYSSVTVDGTVYRPNISGGTKELVVPLGTNIECYIRTYSASASAESGAIAKIIVNGNVVAQTNDNTTYNYIVTKDAVIKVETLSTNNTLGGGYGLITITET